MQGRYVFMMKKEKNPKPVSCNAATVGRVEVIDTAPVDAFSGLPVDLAAVCGHPRP